MRDSQGRAVVSEAFERLLLPGASVEIVARSLKSPPPCLRPELCFEGSGSSAFGRTFEASRFFSSGGLPQAVLSVCPEAVSRCEHSEGGGLAR
eukprot:scaffold14091_cov121-Isochrysis_galbana.AAC.22